MLSDELGQVAAAFDATVIGAEVLAGGFSHQTFLLTLTDGRVVVRLGGPDHGVEAAVMAVARRYVPVPRVLKVVGSGARAAMVLEYVAGTPLSQVLADGTGLRGLGAEVGRIAAAISSATFDRPGFFADAELSVKPERPWSQQLPEFSAECMDRVPSTRLDTVTRKAWADLCAAHAPALADVDDHARLVHSDLNPKNILVTRTGRGWRVDAVLDWEFSYSGCPYADAANMTRFGTSYPNDFLDGFRAAFADNLPGDLTTEDWLHLGRVLDMFALSSLATEEHPIADQAAQEIRRWVADGLPDSR
jgi:Ser/Thr protein kinase RdoA (MazF antagonist)